jgi:aminoglycoside phosphotransferase (APT) family kinase protein
LTATSLGANAVSLRTEAVNAALRAAGELDGEDRVVGIEQLAGGWSRHSYVATASLSSGDERTYVVRVKPQGALLDTDLGLEYRLYDALAPEAIPVPRVHAFNEHEDTPFDGPFIVMEHVEGTAPNMYGRGDQSRLAQDWDGARAIGEDMVRNLAQIHLLAPDRLPRELPELDYHAVVARWREIYETKRLLRDPVVEEGFDWLAHRAPRDSWTGLVHGDYRIGNTLIAGGRVRAILDWELAYRGDVRFDLGYLSIPRASGKHLQARSSLMGTFAELDWFLDRYGALTGRQIDSETLQTFQMLAIMMLLATQYTAVWMYAHGRTNDVRMAWSRFSFAGLRQDMIGLMGW